MAGGIPRRLRWLHSSITVIDRVYVELIMPHVLKQDVVVFQCTLFKKVTERDTFLKRFNHKWLTVKKYLLQREVEFGKVTYLGEVTL